MTEIMIRKFGPGDESAIENITYQTGFKGEDLTGRGYFDDKRLFYLIFIYYYPKYEPQHCFVAVNGKNDNIIGFICGTPDTIKKEACFIKSVIWRILIRAIYCTIWRYPKTLLTLIKMSRMRTSMNPSRYSKILSSYPAHLHINVLEDYQRSRLGSNLLLVFERHMRELGILGIHLQTSNYNLKAIPFYRKMGFELVDETPIKHPIFDDFILLTFAKTLHPCDDD